MWHGKQKRVKNELESEGPSGIEDTDLLGVQEREQNNPVS